jgi:hypothetical protein
MAEDDGDEIRRVEHDGMVEWQRVVDENHLRGVETSSEDGEVWEVGVYVMEYVRDGPLEDELPDLITAALAAVPGVEEAAPEDRGLWLVTGDVDPADLVRAGGRAVDSVLDRTRALYEAPG